ncbi:MAG: CoA-binding protein, partial [Acidobacteria bacterium]|nr:CoA-binding protein [Acidobacteriota bacterium]
MRTIEQILRETKTIAVVGLSSDPMRPSFGIAQALQHYGYRIIPVNPRETEVLGEKSYASLSEIPVPVDLVNVFRRP